LKPESSSSTTGGIARPAIGVNHIPQSSEIFCIKDILPRSFLIYEGSSFSSRVVKCGKHLHRNRMAFSRFGKYMIPCLLSLYARCLFYRF
jgi:hypothetical protein